MTAIRTTTPRRALASRATGERLEEPATRAGAGERMTRLHAGVEMR